MDEVVITIRGKKHLLRLVIGVNCDVHDILLQTRQNPKAAKRFFQILVACLANKGSSSQTNCVAINSSKHWPSDTYHRAHKGLNNAIEVSHRPTRKREKKFGRFKSHLQAQRFLSAHDQINLIFRPAVTNSPRLHTVTPATIHTAFAHLSQLTVNNLAVNMVVWFDGLTLNLADYVSLY